MKKDGFMKGRYGFDMLFFAVTSLCLVMVLLSITVLRYVPYINTSGIRSVAGLAMIINTSRVFSRQLQKREAENARFMLWLKGIIGRNGTGGKRAHRKYSAGRDEYRCSCGEQLIPPEGRGSFVVVCPKCGKRMYIRR